MQKVGYVGPIKGGRPNGKGTHVYASGDVYEGEWKSGNKSGYGKLTYFDGYAYEGNFFLDQRHGRGTLYYRNGDEYVGNWRNGIAHGPGQFRNRSHGVVYNDTWNNGRSTSTGKSMTMMMRNSTWRENTPVGKRSTGTKVMNEHMIYTSQDASEGPSSPCWKSTSKNPLYAKMPRSTKRPLSAPVARINDSSGSATMKNSLSRTRLIEKIIMETIGKDDEYRRW